MDRNFADNFILEFNLENEYKLPTDQLLKELEEFMEMCDNSNAPEIERARNMFLSDVTLRATYRMIPKEKRLDFVIGEVRTATN